MNKRLAKWIDSGKIEITEGCWEWKGCVNSDGYPKVYFNGSFNAKGHRVIYSMYNPDKNISGKVIRHSCDNIICVNPQHLELGTNIDNINDRFIRGRSYNHVNEEEIEHIYSLRVEHKMTYKEISQILNIKIKRVEYIIKVRLQL